MCYGCWLEYGAPQDAGRHGAEAIQAISDVYKQNPSGGNLHIVIDDWNLENDHIRFCRDKAPSPNDPLTYAEQRCASVLLEMTESERAAALAKYEGFDRAAAE